MSGWWVVPADRAQRELGLRVIHRVLVEREGLQDRVYQGSSECLASKRESTRRRLRSSRRLGACEEPISRQNV